MGIFDRAILAWKAMTDPRSIDPNYGTSLQIITPGQPVWTPKNYANFVKEGYRRTASVYACINKISTTASGIQWKLYSDRTMKREIESHALLDLWRKPNLNESQGMFIEKLFGFWHLSGNDYIWAYRPNKNGPPLALWHLRPDRVKVVPSDIGIESYVYGYGTPGMKTYEPEDTLHIKFPAYDDDYYGLSPMETASQLIDQQNEGNAWNTALMQNAGKPASAFFAKGFLTDAARNQIKDELRRKYSGKRNAGMPLVLEGDMTWQNMSMSPYELDWLQSRELNTREIASIFDVAPELIGDSAGKTFANVSEARMALYTENVLPKMDRIVDHVNNWLVPMYPDLKGAYFTYDKEDIEALASLYQASLTSKSERATNLWNTMQCTLDEAREIQGMPALPDGKGKVFKIQGATILVPADKIDEYAEESLGGPELPVPPIHELPPGGTTVQELPPAGGTSASQRQGNNNAPASNNRNGNASSGDDKQSSKRIVRYKGNDSKDEDEEEKHTGVMIALFLDKKSAKKLAIPDGEPAGDLHITLAFLGDKKDIGLDVPALKKVVASYASEAIPLEGTTSGVGRFKPSDNSDGLSAVWAAVNISSLQKWRADLVKQLEAAKIDIASDFDYQPHITLAYVDPDDPMPINDVPELALSFDELWLCIGDDRYSFPIGDEQYPQKRIRRKANQDANYKIWKCTADACDFCTENNGVMVGIDEDFPNGCSTPDDCHKYCKCEANTLYIPDDVDTSHVANWGFATLAAAFGVAYLASRHDKDVAAQRAKNEEDEDEDKRGIIHHDQKYQKALQVFSVDDRYMRLRSLPIRTETHSQERHNGLSGDRVQTTTTTTKTPIGTAEKADISSLKEHEYIAMSRRRKRSSSAYRAFIERYI